MTRPRRLALPSLRGLLHLRCEQCILPVPMWRIFHGPHVVTAPELLVLQVTVRYRQKVERTIAPTPGECGRVLRVPQAELTEVAGLALWHSVLPVPVVSILGNNKDAVFCGNQHSDPLVWKSRFCAWRPGCKN